MEKLMHYEFHRDPLLLDLDRAKVELKKKITAVVEDTTDKAIVQAVIEAAQANGVTDLYLLDKTFIMDALREKQEREKPLTNADRIRAMGDELLATQLVQVFKEGVIALTGVKLSDNLLNEIRSHFLDKLKQPAEEESHEQM